MGLTFEERVKRMFDNTDPLPPEERVTIREVITSKDANIVIPQIISGVLREAAEPNYIGTSFLQRVEMPGPGRSYIIPSVGEIRAHDIPETGVYPEESPDFQLLLGGGTEIKTGKTGLIVRISDEAIQESQWDLIALLLRKAGRAMARFKEEKVFNMLSRQGHIIFDNDLRQQYPEAGTTGRDFDGKFNDTLSVEDIIDMMLVVMANGFTPTDVLMHPLVWMVFAKNEILGSLTFGALGESPGQFQLSPNSIQGRIPFAITVSFSPWAVFDREKRVFDMVVVDRNEVGVLVVKEDLSTEQWNDPERDIQAIKVKERYGMGTLNNGKAIAVARNIAFKLSYPLPERMMTMDQSQIDPMPEEPFK